MWSSPSFPAVAAVVAMSGLGAPAQAPHWADRPLQRPAVPPGPAGEAPLDAFVRVAAAGLGVAANPPASPATWLRRVHLDLTGLPPTPEALDAFGPEPSPAARAAVVEQLFATDAFAERWAQWWLDLARYADSQGYEKDALRPGMWRYRDQVIAAFASDMPFDRFTCEQLAGDLLPEASEAQRVATAFHRQTMTNSEGGTDDEEFRVAAVVDRVDTTLSVWMGATLGCAQCHDHKYDPYSQREFFQLYAFFDQTEDHDRDDDAPVLQAPTERQRAAMKAIELELTAARTALAEAAAAAVPVQQSPWHVLGPLRGGDFATVVATAFAPERDGVQLAREQDGQRWRRADDYADGAVHGWRGDDSAFYLVRTIEAAAAGPARLSLGSDDALVVWWNGVEVLRQVVSRGAAPDQDQVDVALRAGTNQVLLKVVNGRGPGGFCYQLVTDPKLAAQRDAVRSLEAAFEAERGPLVPILRELPPDRRRVTRVHLRGNFLQPGEVVTPDTPQVWPAFGDAPRNRLGFARWLVRDDNPRPARVLANRIWSELFGAGLVTTLEDFGTQGEPCSHPELLDWLACEFREGWSLRRLLRTMVLSATYARSAMQTPSLREVDPLNQWLLRGPSFRLPAEAVRDQALAVSGLLAGVVGGPSVMPEQPDGVWLQIYSGERWVTAGDADRHRRSLYTFWRRTSPHPAMLVFDAQSREACVLRRQRTNTPLQALVLWNDPQFRAPAQQLGRSAAQVAAAGDEAAVQWLWRRCLLRLPTTSEAQRLRRLLDGEREHFASQPAAAVQLVGTAEAGSTGEVAAWTVVAAVVLALDEFVTKP
jgi:hypothetical protein